jgi:hypothetical protein
MAGTNAMFGQGVYAAESSTKAKFCLMKEKLIVHFL